MAIPPPGASYRPRTGRPLASPPLAALALTVLALHWCAGDRKRVALAALAALSLGAPLSRLTIPEPAISPWRPDARTAAGLPQPYLPLLTRPPDREPARSPIQPPPVAASDPEPAAAIVALPAAISDSPPASAAAVAAPPAAAPAARAPWRAPDAALRPYPERIERWRPLLRQLLAEAWNEGRLDGAAAALDDDLLLALIQQESEGDPDALSPVGAIGLMQVMPFTFADVMTGRRDLTCAIDPAAMWDVPSNVRAGIRYLALAMQAFEGNRYWALAAYNAGIETVSDWREAGLYAVPPAGGYAETAHYVPAILASYLGRRPDITMYVPDRMPPTHVPGALRLLQELESRRGPRPPEWYPRCG